MESNCSVSPRLVACASTGCSTLQTNPSAVSTAATEQAAGSNTTHVFILLLLGITIRKAGKENQGEAHNSSLSTGGFARDYNKKVRSLLFALFPYSAKGASQSNSNVLFKPDSKNVTKITSSSFLFLKMLSSTSPTANMIICTRCRLTKPLSVR